MDGLMGIPEYREMVDNFRDMEERYLDLVGSVTTYVDVEAAVNLALAALDHDAVRILRAAYDEGRPSNANHA